MKEYANQMIADAEEDESPMLRHPSVGDCPIPPGHTLKALGQFARETIEYALGFREPHEVALVCVSVKMGTREELLFHEEAPDADAS